MMYYIVIGGLFVYCSVQDIRKREVSNLCLWIGAGLVLLLFVVDGILRSRLSAGEPLPWKQLWGIIPGVCICGVSHVTGGSIGKGDGYLLCISGAALGLNVNLAILCYGLLAAGIWSAVLLMVRKVKKETKLPFVPFLTGGYLLTLLQFI